MYNEIGGGRAPLLICVAYPNRDDFKVEMVTSLLRCVAKCAGKYRFDFYPPQSCFIDEARNASFEHAVEIEADYLLFIDTDTGINNGEDFNFLEHMLSFAEDVVVAVCYQKEYPYRPCIYKFTEAGFIRNYEDPPNMPDYVEAAGTGLMLISKNVLARAGEMPGKPFHYWNYGQLDELKEDAAFCKRLNRLGIKILVTPEIKTSHVGKVGFKQEHWDMAKVNLEA